MSNLGNVRTLLETIKVMAFDLTDEEVSDIAEVVYKALKRMEKEQEVGQ